VGYSKDLAIEKRPKMRCNWAAKSPSYFLPVPKTRTDRLVRAEIHQSGHVLISMHFVDEIQIITLCSNRLRIIFPTAPNVE